MILRVTGITTRARPGTLFSELSPSTIGRHLARQGKSRRQTFHLSAVSLRQDHAPTSGPTARYEELVQSGTLRNDDHQRSIVALLQGLHEELTQYEPVPPTRPLGAPTRSKKGFVSSFSIAVAKLQVADTSCGFLCASCCSLRVFSAPHLDVTKRKTIN